MTVKVKDNGWKKFLKNLFKKQSIGVSVGIQGSDASENHKGSPLSVAQVGEIHEFGYGVPRRSFLRGYYDENYSLLRRRLLNVAKRIANPKTKMTAKKGFGLFGSLVVGGIQKRISAGIWPGLAESTKRARARKLGDAKVKITTPLINTGQLRSSITYKVKV